MNIHKVFHVFLPRDYQDLASHFLFPFFIQTELINSDYND